MKNNTFEHDSIGTRIRIWIEIFDFLLFLDIRYKGGGAPDNLDTEGHQIFVASV